MGARLPQEACTPLLSEPAAAPQAPPTLLTFPEGVRSLWPRAGCRPEAAAPLQGAEWGCPLLLSRPVAPAAALKAT